MHLLRSIWKELHDCHPNDNTWTDYIRAKLCIDLFSATVPVTQDDIDHWRQVCTYDQIADLKNYGISIDKPIALMSPIKSNLTLAHIASVNSTLFQTNGYVFTINNTLECGRIKPHQSFVMYDDYDIVVGNMHNRTLFTFLPKKK